MNLDFGEVLHRAWQITWNHKILWIIIILPFLTVLLFFPFWFIFVFTRGLGPYQIFSLFDDQNFVIIIVLLYVITFAAGIFLQVLSQASVTLGIYRVEAGVRPITFGDLLKSGFPYWGRIFGVVLLIAAAVIVFFLVVFAVGTLLSKINMSITALCVVPLFILMIPLSLLGVAVMEQAEAAVIADRMGALSALRRGCELVAANFLQCALIVLIVYVGMNILMNLITMPVMTLMFLLIEATGSFRNMVQMQVVFGFVLFPILFLIQGVALTYLKSAMMVIYIRSTRFSKQSRPVLQNVAA